MIQDGNIQDKKRGNNVSSFFYFSVLNELNTSVLCLVFRSVTDLFTLFYIVFIISKIS